MRMSNRPLIVAFAGLLLAGPFAALAQQPAAPAAESQPTDGRTQILATVIELHGDVKKQLPGESEWTPCAVDEQYPEGTRLLSGIRSSLKIRIGDEEPYTAMLIDSVGLTELTEAAVAGDTKRVRVGIGYGRVKAGVAEGGLKSDFTVDSPVATLSKRGTWGFSLFYERDTDFFEIALDERGLVEALNAITNERRSINPREAVTSAMRRWLDEASVRRNVPVADLLGQSDIELSFNRLQMDGLGVLSPGQGRAVLIDLNTPQARSVFADLVQQTLNRPQVRPPVNLRRPEGFFGTGRGDDLVEVLIDETSSLARSGQAKSGNYRFRRAALEGWMKANGK